MDTIGERLRHARETANERLGTKFTMTQSELADQLGVTQGYIYKLETNANKRGSVDVIKLMNAAEYLQCSFLWLAKGLGQMEADDGLLIDELAHSKGLPFVPPELAGKDVADPEMMLNLPSSLVSKVSANGFYTLVSDNGVKSRAAAGDMVLVDPAVEIRIGDFVLARVADKSLPIVRRIVERMTEGQSGYTLKSLNDEFADRPLEKISDLLGVVMEFRSFAREECSYKDRLTPATANVVRLVR